MPLFFLLGCSTTEDQLKQCQRDFKAYAQEVERFYQQEIDKRVASVIDENKALKSANLKINEFSDSLLEENKKLALRIESEESAVSHYRYCKLWGRYQFLSIYCDPQKARAGLQAIKDNKMTFSRWTLVGLIILTLTTYLLPLGVFIGGLYIMFWRYKLDDKKQEYYRVQKQHDYLESGLSGIKTENEELHHEKELITDAIIELKKTRATLNARCHHLESKVAKLKAQRDEMSAIGKGFT